MTDRDYMELALALAEQCLDIGEVPVGAVMVRRGEVIAAARNRRETDGDAVAHAEILCIRQACEKSGGWHLTDCTLYVTLEPCPMCAGAIANARVDRVVYGAADRRFGACGGLFSLYDYPLSHRPEVIGGVMAEEAQALLQRFFAEKRGTGGKRPFSSDRVLRRGKWEVTLAPAAKERGDAVWRRLCRHFPEEERRDRDDFLSCMENPAFTVYDILWGDHAVGLISVWRLSAGLFVEHFAVEEAYRGRNIGTDVLSLLKKEHGRIFLESEPPTGEIRERRIAFYERNGFFANDFSYVQPPYRVSGSPLPMVFMSYPEKLTDATVITEIYETVYGITD